tara:strand:- start:9476 stop:9898 length:423 start_codon:yes stop_codon:yes gene_type:complete
MTRHAKADCAAVYDIAAHAPGYPEWSAIGSFEEIAQGTGERYGLGSRRIFRTAGMVIFEEIMVADRPHHLVYRLISGLPLKDYLGQIDLTAEGDQVRIDWYSTFVPPKGFGWFWRRFMQKILTDMSAALVKEAEKRMAKK